MVRTIVIAAALSTPGCAQIVCDADCKEDVSGAARVDEPALAAASMTACRNDECVSTRFKKTDLLRAERPSFVFVMAPVKDGKLSFRFELLEPPRGKELFSVHLANEEGKTTFSWEQNVSRDRLSCRSC